MGKAIQEAAWTTTGQAMDQASVRAMSQTTRTASLRITWVIIHIAIQETTDRTTGKTTTQTKRKTTWKTTNQTTCPTTGGYPHAGYHFGAKAPKYRHFSRFKELLG